MHINKLVGALAVVGLATISSAAFATNGYFAHGYGVKAQGMAGVGIALPQDALAAATNPAGMALVGNRFDIGVTWFRPQREAEIVGNGGGANGVYKGNESENFFIPEFGYNKMINQSMSLGVSVYGNGGMNTDYDRTMGLFSTANKSGVNLEQLFIAPTLAWKATPAHSFGASLNLVYQRFSAKGLENFANSTYSSSPTEVTGKGNDDSYGYGLHLGWVGQITNTLSLGATYQTRTYMSKFDKYKGLFAEQGDFDIPATYGVGFAWKTTPAWTIAGDVQVIEYGDIKAISNPLVPNLTSSKLGNNDGAGFGWKDMTVYKLGVAYQHNKNLTLRGGISNTKQPIPGSETLFNFVAPAVVETHLTLGATWTLANNAEVSVAYMHAFDNKVDGTGSIPAGFGGGNANIKMHQDSLGISYGMKF